MDDPGLDRFNSLAGPQARDELHSCCAAPAWVSAVMSGRPYPHRAALFARAASELAALDWAGVAQALRAHPRIGEPVAGDGPVWARSREAFWSSEEQSAMRTAAASTKAALAKANRAYEERFGHVFLIFATGRTDAQMLAAAQQRLGNDEATEREVVRAELGRIVELRLRKLLGS